ncbi:MAG: ABC transporter ATP-binding protein [Clostridia bacterium]|nr:ABC transporter ATP-binding protein [Clostridia bacterium]MBR6889716.1 ABC transporter ATP-binding protein [Clostridia bacterium]
MSELLKAVDVCKSFQGNVAVDHASLTIETGKITGLIGANGAGKTTLFNCISGYYHMTSGKVYYKGVEIEHKSAQSLCHEGIARTFQIARPFGMLSVLDNVAVGGYNKAGSRRQAYEYAQKSLELVGLADKSDALAMLLNTGEQRKLELARALATQPELLLLDEVMAGLTPTESKTMVELIQKVNQSGITVLMIEHIMPVIMKLSDHIYVMESGKMIADGAPEQIANDQRVIESYLGKGVE